MSNAAYIDWPGQSGRTYRYYFLNPALPVDPVTANYAFVQLLANGTYWPLYFGETHNARTRLTPSHEKWQAAFQAGITHLMARATPGGEKERCAEEVDLIERWRPPLNVQRRQPK